jgi:hypothetical protein
MSDAPNLPLRLRTSRTKMALLFGGSLAFSAAGFLVANKDPIIGYACIAFFGLCGIVGAVGLIPSSSYLELTQDGFTFCSLFRRSTVPWRHVREFLPIKIHHNAMVGWNYSTEFQSNATSRRIATALSGAEGALPDTYGMKAAELATLLNNLRARHAHEL